MKVLLAGRLDGWMRHYLSQVARGFHAGGAECVLLNYREAGPSLEGLKRLFLGKDEALLVARRTQRVLRAIQQHSPDVILTSSGRLDFSAIREAFRGALVFWDMDGPAGALTEEGFPWSSFDLVLTVSRPLVLRLAGSATTPVRYFPHGVDLDFYSPGPLSEAQLRRFAAPLAFVGQTCPRRVALLETIADQGLVVWGSRWSGRGGSPRLKGCVRERRDVLGTDLVALYRASSVVLNILRGRFASPPTILSLQVFAIPATGACLLTDWAEEIEEAFEPDREVLVFRSPEELVEKARRYGRDAAAAKDIGAAGLRRARADHSLATRAARLLTLVREVR